MATSLKGFFSFLLLWAVYPTQNNAAAQDDPPPFIYRVPDVRPAPTQPDPRSPTFLANRAEASRFLQFASFGGSMTDIEAIVGTDATDWLEAEFAKPPSSYLNRILQDRDAEGNFSNRDIVDDTLWLDMMTADDQLRMRMFFALSQIFVVSNSVRPRVIEHSALYADALYQNAFGNYRDLIEEVTYNPIMAKWLTYLENRKGDPETGRMPDENYAREILQLFSIGLLELNRDGSQKLDNTGQPQETYDNDDVVGLARVFTGLGFDNGRFLNNVLPIEVRALLLTMYDEEHSQLEKSFLGTTIPANTNGDESIRIALDTIAEHPNVAPFISRQLIQRFTSSSPSPDYVNRVATAFETGRYVAANGARFGNGTRGDFEAALAAILLDQTLFEQPEIQASTSGKIREPVLKFIQWVRAFNVENPDVANEYRLNDTTDAGDLNQQFLYAPSVFYYYRPGYVAPQTESGNLGLTAPELQIVNASSAVGYANFITDFVFNTTRDGQFEPDYTLEASMADDPDTLVRHLDLLLTGNRLSDTARFDIVDIIDSMRLRTNEFRQQDLTRRARTAVWLVMLSPAYQLIQ